MPWRIWPERISRASWKCRPRSLELDDGCFPGGGQFGVRLGEVLNRNAAALLRAAGQRLFTGTDEGKAAGIGNEEPQCLAVISGENETKLPAEAIDLFERAF